MAILIRTATPDDAQVLATIHVLAWQAGYRGLLPDSVLDGLSVETRTARWQVWLAGSVTRTRVAEQDDQVKGWLTTGPQRDEDLDAATVAEIYALYVHPAAWGAGCGSALMHAALDELAAHGYTAATLWVLRGNARAIRFYEYLGFRADGATKNDVGPGGAVLDEIRLRYVLARRDVGETLPTDLV